MLCQQWSLGGFSTLGAAMSFVDCDNGASYDAGLVYRVVSEWERQGFLGRCPFRSNLTRKEWTKIANGAGCGYKKAETTIKNWISPLPFFDGRGRPPVADEIIYYLDEITADFAELSVSDYQDLVYFEMGEVVSRGWVCEALKKLGLPPRKPSVRHVGRYSDDNMIWSVQYADLVSKIDPRRLRFLDGSGFQQTNTGAIKVRSHSEFPSILSLGGRRSTNFTAMGLTSIVEDYEPIEYEIFDGLMGELDYVGWVLRMYDDGLIQSWDVLVRDNWSGQTGETAQEMERLLASDNITFLPLPTYTPEWNPIEYAWSCAKFRMRRYGPRGDNAAVIARAARALDSVTYANMMSWYDFCGY